MSDPLRIALVAEGPTDGVVIEAAVRSMLHDRDFVLKQIFPETSVAFDKLGTGWTGVYKWCHQSAHRGNGQLRGDALVFQNYDLLILHLDADVAGFRYGDGTISPKPTDLPLPCDFPCPPAALSANSLRAVLWSWCGETAAPDRIVVCMPSKNAETWMLAAIFPGDAALSKDPECYSEPVLRLGQQRTGLRFKKNKRDYQARREAFASAWPRLTSSPSFGEAARFQKEFLGAISKR